MPTMTIDDLRRILVSCAGEASELESISDIHDVEFEALGYDSLALMEVAARIEREFGVRIADERIVELKSPREVLELVNSAAAGSAG